jgi:uncharacterized membrane protein
MESKAKLLGHPIHTMLIPFPLGLLATAVVFDLIHLIFDQEALARAAYYMIAAGIISGLLAAVFGLIDWSAIPAGTRAKSVGVQHMGGNVVVLALFGLAWLLRRDDPHDPGAFPIILELAGGALAAVTGWLGGELVDRMGVGVDCGAHLNSPSSLSDRPASEGATTVTGQRGRSES